jgi:aspartyl-tRNA(Asn)/glutamyl-tRNA(Gln) amidotransferase subunit B
MSKNDPYEIVIGLEVHAQLLTKTKLFCADTTEFGKPPNTQVSPISLGHPGTLPRLNREAITLAVRLGLATNCSIVKENYFARKNYFYPDLPKGYQISQHTTPICKQGMLKISTPAGEKNIRINRIHIEEDAGKSIHEEQDDNSAIDFNRAGTPLLEIVSEPDLRSGEEAAAYVTTLRKLVRHLDVCDGNMEEGSLRCDVNISVRKKGAEELGTRVEIKNLNSVRFIKKAVDYESQILIEQDMSGKKILQQTKGFDETTSCTYVIRTKEDEDDYRYFPEPDLPAFHITEAWINDIRNEMPPLQEEIRQRLVDEFGLSAYDAGFIADDMEAFGYFCALAEETSNRKAAANWVIGPIKNYCAEQGLSIKEFPVEPASMAALIGMIDAGNISYGIGSQQVLPQLALDPAMDLGQFIKMQNLELQSTDETDQLIDAVLARHPEKVKEYQKGKKGLISLFVGEVMKMSKGKADAKKLTEKFIEKLKA